MKTRVISAAILIPVLLIVVLALPKIVAALMFGVMMAIGAYELTYRTGLVKHPRMVIYSAVMAFAVTMWSYYGAVHAYGVLGVLLFLVVLFSEMMHDHIKVRVSLLGICILAGVIVPYLLGAVIRILALKVGRYMVLLPFVVACLNDAGAYIVGIRYGKHKLAPVVSPNKTIEGVLGGLAASVLGMLVYGLVLYFLEFRVNFLLAILYAVAGSGIGVFGDLCFSAIKRQTGIKDYGNLIPDTVAFWTVLIP